MKSDSDRTAPRRATRVISVTSGKGGVGKTIFAANAAIALQRRRKRVLILDADLGLANIDIVLGLRPQYNLFDVLDGGKSIDEIIVRGSGGIDILPAGSGVESITDLDEPRRLLLRSRLEEIDGRYDFVLIDTGAGISSNVVYFNLAAHWRVLVVTPEPTSLTDAYAVIKTLATKHAQRRFQIVANQVSSEPEGLAVYRRLADTADRHLDGVSLGYLGWLSRDPKVTDSLRARQPVIEAFPDCPYAADVRSVSAKLANLPMPEEDGGLGLFWKRLLDPEDRAADVEPSAHR